MPSVRYFEIARNASILCRSIIEKIEQFANTINGDYATTGLEWHIETITK